MRTNGVNLNPPRRRFTLAELLVVQKYIDCNAGSIISDNDVQATQKAVADIWPNPESGKAPCRKLLIQIQQPCPDTSTIS
jgi:hypothetical protein